MNDVLVFDTETTGLPGVSSLPLDKQPSITEFAGIKLNDHFEEIGRLEFMCKPAVRIEDKAAEVSGITNEMVASLPPFSHFLPQLQEFMIGVKYIIAHNISFDIRMLELDLMRLGKVCHFPWPPKHICTKNEAKTLGLEKNRLGDLYKAATGEDIKEWHRAMADTESLLEVCHWMRSGSFPNAIAALFSKVNDD